MFHTRSLLPLTLLFSTATTAPAQDHDGPPEPVRWWTDVTKAEQHAAKTGKPLLFVFR